MHDPARFPRSCSIRSAGRPVSVPRIVSAIVTGFVLGGLALGASGCKLVDQRTFDKNANRKPVPVMPPAPPPAKPVPPLATVRFGAPPESWQPELAAIVREALSRKPDALFTVQTVVPASGNADAQAAAIQAAVGGGGQTVAQTIRDAGAPSGQINMTATTGAVSAPETRVTVR